MEESTSREVLFRFYQLSGYRREGTALLSALRQDPELLRRGEDSDWLGETPVRFGFRHIFRLTDEVVGGEFCLEYEEPKSDFDDHKVEETKSVRAFEKRLFILNSLRMVVGLECTRFVARTGLTAQGFRDRFLDAVTALPIPRQTRPPGQLMQLDALKWHTPKERFLEVFANRRVTKLSVDFDGLSAVPSDFVVFNPHYDKNEIMREVAQNFLDGLPERMTIEMNREKGDAGKRYYPKVPMLVGNPREAEYDNDGKLEYLRREGPVECRINVSGDEDRTDPILIKVTQAMMELPLDELVREASDPDSDLFAE